MATLAISAVSKTYPNGHEALFSVDVEIGDGEFVVLVGPSGCGKSTLMRMVAGLEDITSGEIQIDGKRVNEKDPADRNIAMVFQNYALYPHMSVYKNMAYGLKNRGTPKDVIEQRVKDAAKLLGIEEYLPRSPRQLSGGQRQRVAMGRAIVREPSVFLFDEPLSNLDAKLRNQMRVEIRKLQRKLDVTTVYVTHDQVEAMTMADRIVVLNGGRVEQIGTPAEIYHQPASTFVAEFIGSPPMNMIEARHDGHGTLTLPGNQTIKITKKGLPAGDTLIGIRPEKISIAKRKSRQTVELTLDLVEELGAGRLLHASLGSTPLIIAPPADETIPENKLLITISAEDSYFFSKQTGKRIA
jgi:sn-glycerol 3-phosphate transport system ATP-binding protein